MDYIKVFIPLPEDYPVDVTDVNIEKSDEYFHFHDCLEISYVKDGHGGIEIEGRAYELASGDIFIVNNLERHIFSPDSSLKTTVVLFDPKFISARNGIDYDYLKPFFNRSVHFSNKVNVDSARHADISRLIDNIREEWGNRDSGYRLAVKALLLHLLALLFRYFKESNELSEDMILFHKNYERIRRAFEYIGQNYCETVSLDYLSRLSHMNRTYFCDYFKRVVGLTVSDYIKKLKISKACQLIAEGGMSMSDIACEAGFNSASYFGSVFKEVMGMTPSEYKMKCLK